MVEPPTGPDDLLQQLCTLANEFIAAKPGTVRPESRWLEDVFDSLDEADYILNVEGMFDLSIPDQPQSQEEREIYARRPFTMADFADVVCLRWGTSCSQCSVCGYDLAGLDGRICPECGHSIAAEEA